MIQHKCKAILRDTINNREIIALVNWSKKNKDSIKFKIGKSEVAILKAELYQLLFTVSNPEQQAEMIPVKTEIVKPFARKHVVKLEKDMKAGETLNVHCEVNVPLRVVEALKKELEEKK